MNTTLLLGREVPVNRLGYGAMRLTGQPGNYGPYADWEQGKALLKRAVALGINFIDTARSYGPQWNEKLIAEALYPYPADLVIATKGGVDKTGPSEIVADGSPATLTRQIDEALVNLKVSRIDLFQLHRVDPKVPIEESMGALRAAQNAGKIRFIGLSNVSLEELRRAQSVAPVASVQNRYNIQECQHEALIDQTAREAIVFIPYGPLGAHPLQKGAPLAEGEMKHGLTPAQSALRKLLKRSPNILVIPGTTSIKHLEENVAAAA
jgi:aryl-alcohol dehydrogenase-like predicted oxidoreductase